MKKVPFRLLLLLVCVAGVAHASSVGVTVYGNQNPFLSGMPNGSTCCFGDSAPTNSPAQVLGIPIVAGEIITFTNVTGSVSYAGGTPTDPPDGNLGFLITTSAYEGGNQSPDNIAGFLSVPVDALAGVFLGPTQPTLNPAPASIDFSSSGVGLNFTSLSPLVQQAFFIGDGLTGNGTGSVQQFIVPTGATRLYLGTVDGFGWYNNTGQFDVTVNGGAATPEPGTMLMLGSGVLAAAGALRRKFRV